MLCTCTRIFYKHTHTIHPCTPSHSQCHALSKNCLNPCTYICTLHLPVVLYSVVSSASVPSWRHNTTLHTSQACTVKRTPAMTVAVETVTAIAAAATQRADRVILYQKYCTLVNLLSVNLVSVDVQLLVLYPLLLVSNDIHYL